jgi:DNA-binding winged helix-turn-helix (wHTH) protein
MNARRNFQPGDVLSFGPFSLLVATRLLKRADEPISLGGRALDVLIALTERAGEVVSYRELISIAWPNVTVDEANLRVQIATLRKALSEGEDGSRYISNVAGRGYCFVAPVSIRQGGRLPPKEMLTASRAGSYRRDWHEWSVEMKLFESYRSSSSWDAS